EHRLNALEAVMNLSAEILNDDACNGQWQKRVEGQLRADAHHECERAGGVDDRVGRVHDRGAKEHANGVEVVGGARHDVSGAVALIVRGRKALKVREEIIAQVEFNVARDADHDPASEELEDSFEGGDG